MAEKVLTEEDKQQLLTMLQNIWIEVKGDVSLYCGRILPVLENEFSQQLLGNAQLILQMAVSIARLPVGKRKEGMLSVESLVSGRDKQPYVIISFGAERLQISPEDARQHAAQVLHCAEAAESDAFVMDFFKNQLQLDETISGNLLLQFRKYRNKDVQ